MVAIETVLPEIGLFVSSTGNFNTSILDYMRTLKNNAFVGAVFGFSIPWRRGSSKFARSWTCQRFTTPNTAEWLRLLRFSRDPVVDVPLWCTVLLSRSFRIFRIVLGSGVSVGQKSTLRAHQMAHPGQPRTSQVV